ncbi:MAG TPA: hypothetical protein VFK06_14930 [Candidatus Angelobacter sp.]|nr:hypothetical protein [Candidatus Angelobacter sp.]
MSIFNGFWQGYSKTEPSNLLNQVPAYVNYVTLFVAAPSPVSTVDTNYLCKDYSASQQQQWSAQLQNQGQNVLMSFMDTPSTHWNNVNIPDFVNSVQQEVITGGWNLNGVDIDLESGMTSNWVDSFVNLISSLRNTLGPDAVITADAYTQSDDEVAVLTQVASDLSWVNTMGYFWDTEQMKSAADFYANIMGGMYKVNIGVGVQYKKNVSTPLSEVKDLASFAQQNGAGMMLYGLNFDNPQTPGDPSLWGYSSAINQILNATATLKKTASR